MRDEIVNAQDHPSWRLYRVTYRSGKIIRVWAPSAGSAREQASYRGDVLDPKGPKVTDTKDVTP